MKKYFSWMKRRRWRWALPKGYHSELPNKGNNSFYPYNTIFNLKILFIFSFQFPLALTSVMLFTSQFIRFTSIPFNHKLIFCLFMRTLRILYLCKFRTQLQKTDAPTNMLHGTSSHWIRAFFAMHFFGNLYLHCVRLRSHFFVFTICLKKKRHQCFGIWLHRFEGSLSCLFLFSVFMLKYEEVIF